jgi:hypothetical protein
LSFPYVWVVLNLSLTHYRNQALHSIYSHQDIRSGKWLLNVVPLHCCL